MAHLQADPLLHFLRGLAPTMPDGQACDRELLSRFVTLRDEAAFALLVRRYSYLVLRIAQRILHHSHDAEDVLQATFLVLARRAGSISWHDSIANWLYEVARRLAREAKATATRRQFCEGRAAAKTAGDPLAELTLREALAVLDAELSRMPARYRMPVVLTNLQGATQDEGALWLGWSLTTYKRRLARGRQMLHLRLVKRGLTVVGALAALELSQASAGLVSVQVLRAIIRTGLAGAAGHSMMESGAALPVVALAQKAVKGMVMTRIMIAAAGMLTTGILAVGMGASIHFASAGDSSPQKRLEEPVFTVPLPSPQKGLAPGQRKNDLFGDPLPEGALSRLGTVRHRYVRTDGNRQQLLPDGRTVIASSGAEVRWMDVESGRLTDRWSLPPQLRVEGFAPNGRFALLAERTSFVDQKGKVVQMADIVSMRLWDMRSRKETQRLDQAGKIGTMLNVHFAPEGNIVTTQTPAWEVSQNGISQATGYGVLRAWEVSSGRELWHMGPDAEAGAGTQALGFLPDGKTLVLLDHSANTISLCDATTGNETRAFRLAPCSGKWFGAISPDGSSLLLREGTLAGQPLQVWDLATGTKRLALSGHKKPFRLFAFSPDGKTLVTGGADSFLLVWDWPSGALRRKLDLGTNIGIESLAIAADNQRVRVSIWGERAVRFFDLTTSAESGLAKEAHYGIVHGVEVAPDGVVVSGGSDNTIRLWDIGGHQTGLIHTKHPVGAMSLAIGAGGKLIASGDINRGTILLHDRGTGQEIRRLDTGGDSIGSLKFANDGALLAASGTEGKPGGGSFVGVWNAQTGQLVRRFQLPWIRQSAISSDGCWLAAITRQGVSLWDIAQGSEHPVPLAREIHGLDFAPDGRTLALGDAAGFSILEIATSKERLRIEEPAASSWWLRFSPDGRWLVRPTDRKAQLLDVLGGKKAQVFSGHEWEIDAAAFTPNSGCLLTASLDTTILTWDLAPVIKARPHDQNPLTAQALSDTWDSLGSENPQAAYRAMARLIDASEQAVTLLGERIQPAAVVSATTVQRLLADLDHRDFRRREDATKQLSALDQGARAEFLKALNGDTSIEQRRRIEALLSNLTGPLSPEDLRLRRSAEVLEQIGSPRAQQVLNRLAGGGDLARITQDAKASLIRLRHRHHKMP